MLLRSFGKLGIWVGTGILALLLSSCGSGTKSQGDTMLVSVKDQRMVLLRKGAPIKSYPVSTSKFGLGDKPGSKKTPIGTMVVREKVGGGARPGTVFKGRKPTGEVLRPNSPGRDPIVSRILWLDGASKSTRNAYRRYIYIHGTAEEWRVGTPASYGCIRMKSRDVIDLYDSIGIGSRVHVKPGRLYAGEVPMQDTLLVNSLRRRKALGLGGGEVLAAAAASNRPPVVRRTAPVSRVVAPPKKKLSPLSNSTRRTASAPVEKSARRGLLDR